MISYLEDEESFVINLGITNQIRSKYEFFPMTTSTEKDEWNTDRVNQSNQIEWEYFIDHKISLRQTINELKWKKRKK